jgi:hypothetical protein
MLYGIMKSRQVLGLLLAATALGACASAGPLARHEATTAEDSPADAPGAPGLDQVAQKYQEYQESKEMNLEGNCDRRRITSELVRRYEAAVKAMDAAGYGYGRNSNFAAVQHPRTAYVECAEDK